MHGEQDIIIDCTERLPEEATRRGNDNEHMVTKTLARHGGNGLLPVVFNRGERKLVRRHLMAELELGFEHRRQSLNLILEARLHSVREACNHVLVTGKTHLRQQRLEYFGKMYRQVSQRLDQLSADFLEDMDERFQNLERFKTRCIREREQQRLEKSVDDFLDTLDQLMEEFRHIINEHVGHDGV